MQRADSKRTKALRWAGEVKPMLDVSADQGTFTRSSDS